MINYGICRKCHDVARKESGFEPLIETEVLFDKNFKVVETKPCRWSCLVTDKPISKKSKIPEGCTYSVEQLYYFEK